ncbi:MAG TPA: GIY-YIG nuclease family protein [Thermoanaerobaculia bacterium]|nr:GIY-YIG nuclease family protein [Thermoanaerobaculia bacterium]
MKYVYILRSGSRQRRTYVGMTGDFERRLREHKSDSSPYTSGGGPWSPVVVLKFEDDCRAECFEEYLKSGSGRAFARRHLL